MANVIDQGTLVKSAQARKNLQAYLKEEGHKQHHADHPDHVFGHVFGLAKVKELIAMIDQHNLAEEDAKKHIAGVRIYHAKSKRKDAAESQRDLVIAPVTKDWKDFPEAVHQKGKAGGDKKSSNKKFFLTASGPCPNVCGGS